MTSDEEQRLFSLYDVAPTTIEIRDGCHSGTRMVIPDGQHRLNLLNPRQSSPIMMRNITAYYWTGSILDDGTRVFRAEAVLYWHVASYNVSGDAMTTPEEEGQLTCKCGCGKPASKARQYAKGHYLGNGRKPYQDPESIDLGMCKCGCGTPIPRTDKAITRYRRGNPSQFIRGHVARMPDFPKPPVRYGADNKGNQSPRYGPDNPNWTGGSGDQQHFATRLVIVDASVYSGINAKTCGCGCGWLTYLNANEPDPPFVHGHHLYISAVPDHNYCALHGWLRKMYQKNGICDKCSSFTEPTEFSLIHGRLYTKNREDYRELCKKCHMKYDRPRMKYVALSDQKSIIERYNLSHLYIRKKDNIKQLAIDFDVSFAYAKTLVTTTHVT